MGATRANNKVPPLAPVVCQPVQGYSRYSHRPHANGQSGGGRRGSDRCLTRSYSGRWFDIRQWGILRLAIGIQPRSCRWSGWGIDFSKLMSHPLFRAEKLLNARRRSFNQYQPQFGQRIILDPWPQQHGQSRTLRVCLGQFQWGGPRQTAPGVRQSSKPPGALLLKR